MSWLRGRSAMGRHDVDVIACAGLLMRRTCAARNRARMLTCAVLLRSGRWGWDLAGWF